MQYRKDFNIAGRYRLGRKIGSGSFGDIYLGARVPLLLMCQGASSACHCVHHCKGTESLF
jgi:hypothetical protein